MTACRPLFLPAEKKHDENRTRFDVLVLLVRRTIGVTGTTGSRVSNLGDTPVCLAFSPAKLQNHPVHGEVLLFCTSVSRQSRSPIEVTVGCQPRVKTHKRDVIMSITATCKAAAFFNEYSLPLFLCLSQKSLLLWPSCNIAWKTTPEGTTVGGPPLHAAEFIQWGGALLQVAQYGLASYWRRWFLGVDL